MPNSVVLGSAIVPLREPTAMDFRARLRAGVGPTEVQALLADLDTPVRSDPHIEEVWLGQPLDDRAAAGEASATSRVNAACPLAIEVTHSALRAPAASWTSATVLRKLS